MSTSAMMEPRAAVEQINNSKTTILRDLQIDENFNSDVNKLELRLFRHSRVNISILVYSVCLGGQNCPILIIASASADKSAAKYSEMSVGWRVTFEVVDTLTGSSSLAGRLFEEQPHELYRKWKVYTGN